MRVVTLKSLTLLHVSRKILFKISLNGLDPPMFMGEGRRKRFHLGNKHRYLSLDITPHAGHADGFSATSHASTGTT